jgi:hypothetical protein
MADACAVGGGNDGTLRTCCSAHDAIMCAHHYARTHFVETDPAWDVEHSCVPSAVRAASKARKRLKAYIEADEFLTYPMADAAAKKAGYEGLDDMRVRAPGEFAELVDALCVEMEEDPQYSGNPETGRAWE